VLGAGTKRIIAKRFGALLSFFSPGFVPCLASINNIIQMNHTGEKDMKSARMMIDDGL